MALEELSLEARKRLWDSFWDELITDVLNEYAEENSGAREIEE